MKINRLCLSAALFLFAFATNLHASRLAGNNPPFHTALVPEPAHVPNGSVAIWLAIGAVLGWVFFTVSVQLMIRQERSRVPVRKG